MLNPSPTLVSSTGVVQEEVIPTTEAVEPNDGGEVQSEEKIYTGTDVEAIVKERLLREQKKAQSTLQATLKAEKDKWTKTQNPAPNIEETYKTQLEEAAQKHQTLMAQVTKYRDESLNNQIEKALTAEGCIDSELVARDLKAQGLVSLDEEGNVVVENHKSLSDLSKSYLTKKPYLKLAQSKGGLGTKPPASVSAESGDPSKLLLADIEAQLGIRPKGTSALFGK